MMGDYSKTERRRVAGILARDKAERIRERARLEAQMRVEAGDIASSADAMIEPTEEWHQHGEARPYTPRQDDKSVRVIRTVRRTQSAYVRLLYHNGRITEDQYRACLWYRIMHEAAGLEGRCKTANYSQTFGGSVPLFGYMPRHEAEAMARQAFRGAEEAVGHQIVGFFNRVVLKDQPILPSSNSVSKSVRKRAYLRFSTLCEQLVEYVEEFHSDVFGKIDLDRDG